MTWNDTSGRRRRKGRMALFLLAAGLLLGSCGAPRSRTVLLVIADTTRADHLHCYGYEGIHTPRIDRLAEDGTLYEKAFTAVPMTLPSISTILTGAYPCQHGVRDNGPYQLDPRWTTLAECFRDAGYHTAAFVSAAVLSHDHRLDQGFDIYDDDVSMPYVPYQPLMVEMRDQLQGIERRAEVTVGRALGWLDRHREGNVFLMVHLFDAHLPHDPPPEFATTYKALPYDGEIAYVDQQIGRLLDGIHRSRPSADLLTVFVADHGEGLGDHEEAFHGDLLFNETVRVPLILQGKGIPRGARNRQLVRTADIVPTLCGLEGLPVPPWVTGVPLPGIPPVRGKGGVEGNESLGGRTASDARPTSRRPGEPALGSAGTGVNAAYLETFRPRLSSNWCELRGLCTQRWKLIEGPQYELYDLDNDPKEKTDLAEERPAVRDSLIRLMDAVAFGSVRKGSHHAPSLELSQEEREKLQSLGYITPKVARTVEGDSLAVFYFPPEERGRALHLPNPRTRTKTAYERILARSFYNSARAALEHGDLEGAAQRFEMAVQHDKGMTAAWLGMAEAARRAGHPEAELRYLEQARVALPEDSAIAGALADARGRAKRAAERGGGGP